MTKPEEFASAVVVPTKSTTTKLGATAWLLLLLLLPCLALNAGDRRSVYVKSCCVCTMYYLLFAGTNRSFNGWKAPLACMHACMCAVCIIYACSKYLLYLDNNYNSSPWLLLVLDFDNRIFSWPGGSFFHPKLHLERHNHQEQQLAS